MKENSHEKKKMPLTPNSLSKLMTSAPKQLSVFASMQLKRDYLL